ncbi:hypothetical protein G5714_004342 [Onychostoma macrolepis]|uniref:Uncharacterized protein n=1 Tax=Onychostoma macrolepis TaxID=369639 RepID=A0A7J6D4F3_9TELE|nr:hypothetical protein G5714_004342 [Onychostoma macrolepis]
MSRLLQIISGYGSVNVTSWKIEKYLHDLEGETFQSDTNDNDVSHSPKGTEETTPTDTGPQDNILLQQKTTKESPSIEKQVNLPLRTEQPIAREIQDDSPKSHSPETSEDGTSSEVQNINHAASGSSNDHVTDTSWLNILAFSLKHNVTGALMEDLLKLLRLFTDTQLDSASDLF